MDVEYLEEYEEVLRLCLVDKAESVFDVNFQDNEHHVGTDLLFDPMQMGMTASELMQELEISNSNENINNVTHQDIHNINESSKGIISTTTTTTLASIEESSVATVLTTTTAGNNRNIVEESQIDFEEKIDQEIFSHQNLAPDNLYKLLTMSEKNTSCEKHEKTEDDSSKNKTISRTRANKTIKITENKSIRNNKNSFSDKIQVKNNREKSSITVKKESGDPQKTNTIAVNNRNNKTEQNKDEVKKTKCFVESIKNKTSAIDKRKNIILTTPINSAVITASENYINKSASEELKKLSDSPEISSNETNNKQQLVKFSMSINDKPVLNKSQQLQTKNCNDNNKFEDTIEQSSSSTDCKSITISVTHQESSNTNKSKKIIHKNEILTNAVNDKETGTQSGNQQINNANVEKNCAVTTIAAAKKYNESKKENKNDNVENIVHHKEVEDKNKSDVNCDVDKQSLPKEQNNVSKAIENQNENCEKQNSKDDKTLSISIKNDQTKENVKPENNKEGNNDKNTKALVSKTVSFSDSKEIINNIEINNKPIKKNRIVKHKKQKGSKSKKVQNNERKSAVKNEVIENSAILRKTNKFHLKKLRVRIKKLKLKTIQSIIEKVKTSVPVIKAENNKKIIKNKNESATNSSKSEMTEVSQHDDAVQIFNIKKTQRRNVKKNKLWDPNETEFENIFEKTTTTPIRKSERKRKLIESMTNENQTRPKRQKIVKKEEGLALQEHSQVTETKGSHGKTEVAFKKSIEKTENEIKTNLPIEENKKPNDKNILLSSSDKSLKDKNQLKFLQPPQSTVARKKPQPLTSATQEKINAAGTIVTRVNVKTDNIRVLKSPTSNVAAHKISEYRNDNNVPIFEMPSYLFVETEFVTRETYDKMKNLKNIKKSSHSLNKESKIVPPKCDRNNRRNFEIILDDIESVIEKQISKEVKEKLQLISQGFPAGNTSSTTATEQGRGRNVDAILECSQFDLSTLAKVYRFLKLYFSTKDNTKCAVVKTRIESNKEVIHPTAMHAAEANQKAENVNSSKTGTPHIENESSAKIIPPKSPKIISITDQEVILPDVLPSTTQLQLRTHTVAAKTPNVSLEDTNLSAIKKLPSSSKTSTVPAKLIQSAVQQVILTPRSKMKKPLTTSTPINKQQNYKSEQSRTKTEHLSSIKSNIDVSDKVIEISATKILPKIIPTPMQKGQDEVIIPDNYTAEISTTSVKNLTTATTISTVETKNCGLRHKNETTSVSSSSNNLSNTFDSTSKSNNVEGKLVLASESTLTMPSSSGNQKDNLLVDSVVETKKNSSQNQTQNKDGD